MRTPEENKLRDEFARHALVAIAPLVWEQSDLYATEADLMRMVAESSYLMADAMMKARNLQTEGKN